MTDSNLIARWKSWSPELLSVLRIITAFLFMQVGTAKLFAFPAAVMPGGGTAAAWSLPWVAGMLETFGGALVLVGLWTRPVAFILSGEMAFAYFYQHWPPLKGGATASFWPIANGGELAIMFCFAFLLIATSGAGVAAVDARRRGMVGTRTTTGRTTVPRTTAEPAAPRRRPGLLSRFRR